MPDAPRPTLGTPTQGTPSAPATATPGTPSAPATATTPTPAATPARATATAPDTADGPGRPRLRLALFVGLGMAVALALAFFVSPEASSKPDGLNKVAVDEGFAGDETAHDLEDSPLAGYGVEGVDDDRLSTGLSGIVGVAVTFVIVGGTVLALRQVARRRSPTPT